ncbi:IS3 family transposase, partial [Shewanella sp. AS16]|nr:IS3 family transposase [Shewanella sp. AS16]
DVRLPEQFSLVEKLKQSHTVKRICEVFGLHRSSYKYWRSRPKVISPEKVKLQSLIREAHAASNGSAGARSVAEIVTAKGINLSRY